VDTDAITERHIIRPMKEAAGLLDEITRSWASSDMDVIPEVDWSRMRSLSFQETLQSRMEMEKKLGHRACELCANFDSHVSFPWLSSQIL
jgi:antiviral helicase SKI2